MFRYKRFVKIREVVFFLILVISLSLRASLEETIQAEELKVLRPVLDEKLHISRALRVQFKTPQQEITLEACEQLRSQVELNYALSPFYVRYEGGVNSSVFCGSENARFKVHKIFLDEVSFSNFFGREARKQLSFFQTNRDGFGFGGYLLNEKNELIEAFYFQLKEKDSLDSKTHYSLWSLDSQGNYHAQTAVWPEGTSGENIQHYTSWNLELQAFRVEQVKSLTKEYRWTQSADWQMGLLIPTHAWSNPFFLYEGRWKRERKNANHWIESHSQVQMCQQLILIRNFKPESQSQCSDKF